MCRYVYIACTDVVCIETQNKLNKKYLLHNMLVLWQRKCFNIFCIRAHIIQNVIKTIAIYMCINSSQIQLNEFGISSFKLVRITREFLIPKVYPKFFLL